MTKCYLFLSGIKKIAPTLNGQEVIHLGIRPYGFHAGNALALFVYPLMLCQELHRLGVKPRFTIIYSINDWEQDNIDSQDKAVYPFNIKPQKTILKFSPSKEGKNESIVDIWEPRIRETINKLLLFYPELNLRFIRNSWLKQEIVFQKMLVKTINKPEDLADLFKKYSRHKVLPNPIYASPVCPHCFGARNPARIFKNGRLKSTCSDCGYKFNKAFSEYEYWWYHKPLFIARQAVFKMDLAISGGDHYNEGDFRIRLALSRQLAPNLRMPNMLFSPVLLTPRGERMSKSQNNAQFANIKKLINLAKKTDKDTLKCSQKILSKYNLYEKYNFSL